MALNQLGQDLGARLALGDALGGARAFLVVGQLEAQCGLALGDVLAPARGAEIVVVDLGAGDGVRVVERDDARVGPQHLLFEQLVRAERVFGVRDGGEGDVVLFGVGPAGLELACAHATITSQPVSQSTTHARKDGRQKDDSWTNVPCQKGK